MSEPPTSPYALTPSQKSHFLLHGYIKLTSCFTPAQAAQFTTSLFPRLGISPTDKSTWTKERIHMPWHNFIDVKTFAPKAWVGICELLGGEERIDTGEGRGRGWSDGFICNFGREEYEAEDELDLRSLDNWHNDGDFFVHYLDSPEQGLLVIPLWSNIKPKGGGTVICTDGLGFVARHLYEHPEGVTPWMVSLNDPKHETYEGREFWNSVAWDPMKTRPESFIECTGEVGDVYLLHPLMLHSASKNLTRELRVITNPPVGLKEPFCFEREGDEYSLVEEKTMRELRFGRGKGLEGWKIEGGRKGWVSQRMRREGEERRLERERLEKLGEVGNAHGVEAI